MSRNTKWIEDQNQFLIGHSDVFFRRARRNHGQLIWVFLVLDFPIFLPNTYTQINFKLKNIDKSHFVSFALISTVELRDVLLDGGSDSIKLTGYFLNL